MTVNGYMLRKASSIGTEGFLAHFDLAAPAMAVFHYPFAIRVRFILAQMEDEGESTGESGACSCRRSALPTSSLSELLFQIWLTRYLHAIADNLRESD